MSAAAVGSLLVVVLLGHSTGQNLSQHSPVKVVVATANQTVTLPCSIPENFTSNSSWDPRVEWSKNDTEKYNIIFLYIYGRKVLETMNENFVGRTDIILKELKKGNLSLLISNVQLTDSGIYQCIAEPKGGCPEVLSVVKLIVVSEPIFSVVPAEDDQVSVQCQVDYCSTEPDIKILDHEGKTIDAESPIKDVDSRGCGTSRIRVNLQSPTTLCVTCQVHHLESNVTKKKTLTIPAGCMKSCPTTPGIGFIGGVVAALNGPRIFDHCRTNSLTCPSGCMNSCTTTTVIGFVVGVLAGVVVALMGPHIWNRWIKPKMAEKWSKASTQSAAGPTGSAEKKDTITGRSNNQDHTPADSTEEEKKLLK